MTILHFFFLLTQFYASAWAEAKIAFPLDTTLSVCLCAINFIPVCIDLPEKKGPIKITLPVGRERNFLYFG
jgi:hypothetical protein